MKSKLKRMIIEPSSNGGATIHHEMPMKKSGKSPAFFEREEVKPFTFGPENDDAIRDHIHNHLGLAESQKEAEAKGAEKNAPEHEEEEEE